MPNINITLAFSLKPCTAIDRPAVNKVYPLFCNKAFIGTINIPPAKPVISIKGMATHKVFVNTNAGNANPSQMPKGNTLNA